MRKGRQSYSSRECGRERKQEPNAKEKIEERKFNTEDQEMNNPGE